MNPSYYRDRPMIAGDALRRAVERSQKRDATARRRLGKRIRTVDRLLAMVDARRSVYVEGCIGLRPAAFVVSMQARLVLRWLKAGVIREYHPA